MSNETSQSSSLSRRDFLGTSATVLATSATMFAPVMHVEAAEGQGAAQEPIHPFKFHASKESLDDLRRRVGATKWPTRELVEDATQGVQLATMRELARNWHSDYDWRKFEARLNALPQFTTRIDGVDIHFIHVRSKNPGALPVIITHGWPGSIVEQMKIIDPLTNPTAHGGDAADAFDVVIPSLPGHGFSGKPTELGWDPIRIARAWAVLINAWATGATWHRAATGAMRSPSRWRCRSLPA